MQQQLDNRDTLIAEARLSPAQRALFCTLRRILIAALKTIDELLEEDRHG